MLRYTDMQYGEVDKVQTAINRLKAFEPPEGYYLAFSGGKDSTVLKALADMAGVKYDAHYNATTVDPPELVRFIKAQHPDVEIVKPEIPMIKLIPQKGIPPIRQVRYCCAYYKEANGKDRVTLTGTRWAESANRKNNQGLVTVLNKKASETARENGAEYTQTGKKGIVMNYDDSPTRRTVEMCYRTHRTLVNPIIDWEDEDVWEFIHTYNIPYCSLYDEGWKRLGCVGCPLGGEAAMKRELERWPAIRKLYIRAFERTIARRKERGMPCRWETGEDVMRWWLKEEPETQIPGQMDLLKENDDGA